jgi:hypothetical protein
MLKNKQITFWSQDSGSLGVKGVAATWGTGRLVTSVPWSVLGSQVCLDGQPPVSCVLLHSDTHTHCQHADKICVPRLMPVKSTEGGGYRQSVGRTYCLHSVYFCECQRLVSDISWAVTSWACLALCWFSPWSVRCTPGQRPALPRLPPHSAQGWSSLCVSHVTGALLPA